MFTNLTFFCVKNLKFRKSPGEITFVSQVRKCSNISFFPVLTAKTVAKNASRYIRAGLNRAHLMLYLIDSATRVFHIIFLDFSGGF